MARKALMGQGVLIVEGSRSHSTHSTVGRAPLDERLSRRRDIYLTTYNIQKRQPSMLRRDSNPQSQHPKP